MKAPILALATRNPGKVGEIRLALEGVEVRTVDDFPDFPDVEETEPDLRGNARLKSEALFAHTGIPSLADDTGLEVRALNGAPGVLSARYAGADCSPADNRALLLQRLEGVTDRAARFRTVLSFTDRSGTQYFEGTCSGLILPEERGSGGFGYDAIFQPIASSCSFAELTPKAKNEISHRGEAVRLFVDFYRQYIQRP
jgi:XTP/dITP diphosphohydrolase